MMMLVVVWGEVDGVCVSDGEEDMLADWILRWW